MNKESIVFEPGTQVQVPAVFPDFPAVPSAYYFYLNSNGNKIAALNNVGTQEEKQESLRIWYSLKSKTLFPLKTTYAQARSDQLVPDPPVSEIALSMKSGLRQIPSMIDWFIVDQYTLVLSQKKNPDMAQFHELFYQFPLNPSADGPQAGGAIEQYLDSGDEAFIYKYLEDHDVVHLLNHPLGYYPVTELFFLMTRYASYPFNDYQLQLCQRRVSTKFDSPDRLFIDSVFYEKGLEIGRVLETLNQIQSEGPSKAGVKYGTDHPNWVRWADEYMNQRPAVPIENLAGPLSEVVEKLYTWTDFQIDALLDRLKVTPPFEREFPARYPYIASLTGTIKRFRADPGTLAKWLLETQEDLLGLGSVS